MIKKTMRHVSGNGCGSTAWRCCEKNERKPGCTGHTGHGNMKKIIRQIKSSILLQLTGIVGLIIIVLITTLAILQNL